MKLDIQKIRALIGSAKTKQAIEELLSIKTEYNNEIINSQTRLSTLKRKELTGIISNSDANTERNSINYSLLEIMSMIEDEAETGASKVNAKPEIPIKGTDQEGLEKVIGRNGLQSISWLRRGAEKAKSVCKVHTADGYVGTGFLIEGGYLLTNNHNIPSNTSAQYSRIEFGFDGENVPSTYALDHRDFITSKALDYSRIKIKDDSKKPIGEWGFLDINPIPPQANDALVIIQHPDGRPQEIAFSDGNKIWDHRLQYDVSTEPGSSGSPVFDINWQVVAIHHAGGKLAINQAGDRADTNEGILMEDVLKDIDKQIANVKSTDQERTIGEPIKIDKPIKTLLVYHSEDSEYADGITSHLFSHIRRGNIELFDLQDDIPPGDNVEDVRQKELTDALLILVLISSNLYKKGTMKIALSVEESIGEKKVIPIRIAPFDLNGTPFEKLQGLPVGGKSIIDYGNIDTALYETVQSISTVIDKILK